MARCYAIGWIKHAELTFSLRGSVKIYLPLKFIQPTLQLRFLVIIQLSVNGQIKFVNGENSWFLCCISSVSGNSSVSDVTVHKLD